MNLIMGYFYISSSPVFSAVRVIRSLVLCFVDRCLSFCTFSFGHCVVRSSSIDDSDYPFGIFKLFSISAEEAMLIYGPFLAVHGQY